MAKKQKPVEPRYMTPDNVKELDEFLLARAMEHASPTLLFRLACEYLMAAKIVRPRA